MEEFATIRCPYCGQAFDVAVDREIAHQQFTTDCEVCCRPLEVRVECADGRIQSADASG